MESDEILKLVDGIYKNILDKFNPGARQLINAGKAYLKALHGSAAAARLYIDAIAKLANQAQHSSWNGSSDVGTSLMQIAEVYQEIHSQQMNVLKAFYVDLIVPLENNLEKDVKIVQTEQKKFQQQQKNRNETYSKAANTMKKHRKKNRSKGTAISKELRDLQALEEEKAKLDGVCEKGLKNALTQERRRYGFILERQCTLAKHILSYHSLGSAALQRNMDEWKEVARGRDILPESVEMTFANKLQQLSFWPDKEIYSLPRTSISTEDLDDSCSMVSGLHKAKSLDAHCFDKGGSVVGGTYSNKQMSRTKSEFNLNTTNSSHIQELEQYKKSNRSKSIATGDEGSRKTRNKEKFCRLARALYAYISNGDNQLSFLEGDVIALMGERNKGWQFGENMRTQRSGWFPLAYTELMVSQNNDSDDSSPTQQHINLKKSDTPNSGNSGETDFSFRSGSNLDAINGAMSLPNLKYATHNGKIQDQKAAASSNSSQEILNIPPVPTNTAPRPTGKRHNSLKIMTPSWSSDDKNHSIGSSMYSSSDSGFIREPLPEVDYDDNDETNKDLPVRRDSDEFPVHSATKTFAECDQRNLLLYKSALELWDDVEKNNNDPEVIDYYASLSKIPHFRPNNAPVKRSKTLWGLKFKPIKSGFLTAGKKNSWQHTSTQNLCSKNSFNSKMVQRPKDPPPLPPLPPMRQDFP